MTTQSDPNVQSIYCIIFGITWLQYPMNILELNAERGEEEQIDHH